MAGKLKIYLDTSVPNAYLDNKNSIRQEVTKDLWARLDQYRVFISNVVVEEIEATGDENKKTHLLDLVKEFEKLSSKEEEVETLTEEYIRREIIPFTYFVIAVLVHIVSLLPCFFISQNRGGVKHRYLPYTSSLGGYTDSETL